MPETKIDSATTSNLTNVMVDFGVDTATTDGAFDQPETTWMDDQWTAYFGYYTDEKIPEIASVIDAKATWTVGKGFKAEPEMTVILDAIKGNGFDTFNTILENAMRTMLIGGNFYAEKIYNDNGKLINLKPLDPTVMRHHANRQGIITRFEQISKIKGSKAKRFPPEKIFYLARNRVADEIHGRGIIQKLKLIMNMKNEAMADQRTSMHRYVVPRWIIKLDTDNQTEINTFKTKMDKANANGENVYIPMGTVEMEPMAMAPNATLNPMAWITYLDNLFYEAAGVPKIILGGSGEFTEASAKIAYLAFQQGVEEEQLYIEEQVGIQLGIEIELEFPASLENELLSDQKKDGAENIQPNETTAGSGQ